MPTSSGSRWTGSSGRIRRGDSPRLIGKATQSQLNRIISSPIYPSVTIRNWNTTTKLLWMMEEVS